MNNKKQKLELTWIGKDEQPRLEPRILIEDPERSYGHTPNPSQEGNFKSNMLIHGDNLLALKALEQDFAEKIKCIYIDPPFNTGAAFEHYDDGLEHSIWLDLMYRRIKILHGLLRSDGFMTVHLDDSEASYMKVFLDEIFGRANYLNTITISANSPFGFKHTSKSIFKTANFLFLYAKDITKSQIKTLYKAREYDTAYKFILKERTTDYKQWAWVLVAEETAINLGFESANKAKRILGKNDFEKAVAEYAIANCERVFRTASVTGGALQKRRTTIEQSKTNRNKIFTHPNDDMPYFFLNGERILFYDERMQLIDGKKQPGEVLTDMWNDISWEGIATEGDVDFPKGKKPEKLIERIIDLTTMEGDWVLDSFGGSGTTGAVAHKMGRKWIMVELGEHCHTHCLPRLQKVIDGTDQGGISKAVGWQGGGGFKYYYLAPSLLKEDKYGNWIIDERYNPNMLAAAMAKHEGFKYSPDETVYWKQGKSTEKDYIFTTTNFITVEFLDKIHEEMQAEESLLICCKSFSRPCGNRYPNITVRKIPNMLLGRCEFGKEDYSLNIINMPVNPDEPEFVPVGMPANSKSTKSKKGKPRKEASLFEEEAE
ncbi:MAG: site-specific DNA-methyltransferase [Nitrospirae bacterium CG01_land_8_20_14_3_00_44_22]|nr:MAG: site-specific DNA-methyltransferase [Nitrospirae bacterium CG01_land_8_20_14_3_00_44_22]